MNALQTRSPRMGWLGVQTARDELFCWRCAFRMHHHGTMLAPEDVLADDRCDRCGTGLLTGEELPAPDLTRELVALNCAVGSHGPSISDFRSERPRGIRLRKLRWHERLRRWLTLTE